MVYCPGEIFFMWRSANLCSQFAILVLILSHYVKLVLTYHAQFFKDYPPEGQDDNDYDENGQSKDAPISAPPCNGKFNYNFSLL